LVAAHTIPADNVFTDWQDATARPKFADAVIIATQDQMHTAPALAFARLGYHILLEKPMAPNPEECHAIVDTVKAAGVLFGVCHVLRYTRYTQRLKALVTSGADGRPGQHPTPGTGGASGIRRTPSCAATGATTRPPPGRCCSPNPATIWTG
jgi:predicted dehydrogenase